MCEQLYFPSSENSTFSPGETSALVPTDELQDGKQNFAALFCICKNNFFSLAKLIFVLE